MVRCVVGLGGSILAPRDPDPGSISTIVELLRPGFSAGDLDIVIGGGWPARHLIDLGRSLGLAEVDLDHLGIHATRGNAALLGLLLGHGITVPATIEAAVAARTQGPVVMGGTHPGHTTDAVAALLAEALGVHYLVTITSIDGVYSVDPRRDPDATRYPNLSYPELLKIVGEEHSRAGPNTVIDPKAARVMERATIRCAVVSGDQPDEVRSALAGEDFHGTLIA